MRPREGRIESHSGRALPVLRHGAVRAVLGASGTIVQSPIGELSLTGPSSFLSSRRFKEVHQPAHADESEICRSLIQSLEEVPGQDGGASWRSRCGPLRLGMKDSGAVSILHEQRVTRLIHGNYHEAVARELLVEI